MPDILLPQVPINLATMKSPVAARLIESRIATASRKSAGWVRHLAFEVAGTPLAGKVIPGQSIGIIQPGLASNGKPHKLRLYSVASPTAGEDGQGNVVSTVVKRLIDEHWEDHTLHLGSCSNYLCNTQVGEAVTLCGPAGKRFILPQNAEQFGYLFISTGTGIAPFRGMVIDLLAAGCREPIYLISGAAYASDLLYHDQFLALAQQHDNFHYLTAISREKQEDGHDRLYVADRLTTHREALLPLLSEGKLLVYLCGVAGMELGVYQKLATYLSGSALEHYLKIDGELLSDLHSWGKDALRKIEKSDAMFVEVYD